MEEKPPLDDTSWDDKVDSSPVPVWRVRHAELLIQWIEDLIHEAVIPEMPYDPLTDSKIVNQTRQRLEEYDATLLNQLDQRLKGFWFAWEFWQGAKVHQPEEADECWKDVRDHGRGLIAWLKRPTGITVESAADCPGGKSFTESGFTCAQLCEKLGIEDSGTINRYAKKAGVTTPKRGKRNHRYTASDAQKIAEVILRKSSQTSVLSTATEFLDWLRNPK